MKKFYNVGAWYCHAHYQSVTFKKKNNPKFMNSIFDTCNAYKMAIVKSLKGQLSVE